MRDIKFRAWHIEQEKMFCVESLYIADEYCVLNDGDIYSDAFSVKTGDIELMQYTDIQDRKGNELCEGDICKVAGMGLGVVEICKYNGTQFKTFDGCDVPVIDCLAEDDDFEIVGNVHQNPELLEQNDE